MAPTSAAGQAVQAVSDHTCGAVEAVQVTVGDGGFGDGAGRRWRGGLIGARMGLDVDIVGAKPGTIMDL
jgi:hypothetical protein